MDAQRLALVGALTEELGQLFDDALLVEPAGGVNDAWAKVLARYGVAPVGETERAAARARLDLARGALPAEVAACAHAIATRFAGEIGRSAADRGGGRGVADDRGQVPRARDLAPQEHVRVRGPDGADGQVEGLATTARRLRDPMFAVRWAAARGGARLSVLRAGEARDMTTRWHPALAPLEVRWTTFLDKVRARVMEIDREATAAYAEVIAADAIDGTALSGVSSALKARLLQLGAKVDDSWSTIDAEVDKLDLEDGREAGRFQGAMLTHTARFKTWLERETERIITQGEAGAARALHAVALEETRQTVPCQHCGAELGRPLWHQAINVTCPHCKAVSVLTPGTASVMFTAGGGAIFLAREAAWPAWCAMQDAEVLWHRLRHKTLDDLARWEAANRAYWQTFASAMGSYHPGWTAAHVANEVTGKMSQFMLTTAVDDRTVRENNGVGIAAVAAGDPARVSAWVNAQRDADDAAETLIVAALERGWHQHATWIAQVLGLGPDTVDELAYYQANRGA